MSTSKKVKVFDCPYCGGRGSFPSNRYENREVIGNEGEYLGYERVRCNDRCDACNGHKVLFVGFGKVTEERYYKIIEWMKKMKKLENELIELQCHPPNRFNS